MADSEESTGSKAGKAFDRLVKLAVAIGVGYVAYQLVTDPSSREAAIEGYQSITGQAKQTPQVDSKVNLRISNNVIGCVGGDCSTLLKIVNMSDPIFIRSVVINERAGDPSCNFAVGKTLKLGDDWSINYLKSCGEIVRLSVITDHTTERYEMGSDAH